MEIEILHNDIQKKKKKIDLWEGPGDIIQQSYEAFYEKEMNES